MAFGKPLSELKLDDLDELKKNDIRESPVLEYKRELKGGNEGRDDALKEMSALANTFGGHLIYGIADKGGQNRGQIDSIEGVERIPGFKQKFIQWAVRWLYPPLLGIEFSDPIPVGKANRACYVIHIPASLAAPHFVETRQGCYIRLRLDEHSMTFEPRLATLDEILRLTDRRKAILKHRETLAHRAFARLERRLTGKEHEDYYTERPLPVLVFWACPEFPLEPLIAPVDLHGTIQKAEVKHVAGALPSRSGTWSTQEDGIIVTDAGIEGTSHLEVSTWGSVLAAQELCREEDRRGHRLHRSNVFGHHLIVYPLLYLLLLRNWVKCTGFSATLFVSLQLRHIRGVQIQGLEVEWRLRQRTGVQDYARSLLDDAVSWETTLSAGKLDCDFRSLAVSAYRRLAFGVGCRDAYENPSDQDILQWARNQLWPEGQGTPPW